MKHYLASSLLFLFENSFNFKISFIPIELLETNIGNIQTKYLERVSHNIKNKNTPNIQMLKRKPILFLDLNKPIEPIKIKNNSNEWLASEKEVNKLFLSP